MDTRTSAPASATPTSRSKVRPTLEALGWLLLALLLLYQGWLRGVNLVALLAAFLLGLWLLNLLWVVLRFRMKHLSVRRQVKEAAFAGRKFTVEIEVHNPTRESLLGLRAQEQDRLARQGWLIPVLRSEETFRQNYPMVVERRGPHQWAPVEISTGYPFGLFRRTLQLDTKESVLVLPRLGHLHVGRFKRLLLDQVRPTASTRRPVHRHAGAQTEFHGLREFRSGDSPRWIHWRTSARVGDLMVREYEEPPVDHLVIVLDPWLPEPADVLEQRLRETRRANREKIQLLLAAGPAPTPEKRRAKEAALARKELPFRMPLESLELAVSLCATICWEWCHHVGARIAMGIGGRPSQVCVVDTGHRQAFPLLEALALVQGVTADLEAAALEPLLQAPLPPGPVVLVTTRSSGLADFLGQELRRPVLALDVRDPELGEIFELEPASTAATDAAARRS